MRTVKIQFDDSEPSDSVARRIVFAFNPGNYFKIRESFFRVTGLNTVYAVAPESVPGEYALVVPSDPNAVVVKSERIKLIGESVERRKARSEIPPPPPEDRAALDGSGTRAQRETMVRSITEAEDERILTMLELKPGQVWKPRDPRRKNPFTIAKVEDGIIHANDGRKVAIERLHRYEMVS